MQNELTTESRLVIANQAAAAYASITRYTTKGRPVKTPAKVWSSGSAVRVYLDKGNLVIERDGAITINEVGAVAAHQSVAATLADAGLTVTETTMTAGY